MICTLLGVICCINTRSRNPVARSTHTREPWSRSIESIFHLRSHFFPSSTHKRPGWIMTCWKNALSPAHEIFIYAYMRRMNYILSELQRVAPMRCTCVPSYLNMGESSSLVWIHLLFGSALCVFIARAPPRNMVYYSIHVMHTRI